MPQSGFVDVSKEVGAFEVKGGSPALDRCLVVDVDGDGFEDIVAWACGKFNLRLFMNHNGKWFTDETEERGLLGEWGELHICNAFDFRCRGHFDLYVGNWEHSYCSNRLFLNDGAGHFTPSGFFFPHGSKGVMFCDVNGDGWIDMLDSGEEADEGGTLFMNLGGQILADETRDRFGGKRVMGYQGCAFADFNNDGYPDMFTTGWYYGGGICHMYVNDGAGHFREVTDKYDLTFHEECNGADGAAFADLNNSGNLDLIAVKNGTVWIHENVDNGKSFPRRAVIEANDFESDPEKWCGESVAIADFDNDGYLDLYVAGTKHVYRNEGNFKFTKAWEIPVPPGEQTRTLSFGDLNCDGKVDILYSALGHRLRLYRNMVSSAGSWLELNLIGPSRDAGGYGVRISVFDHGHAGEMSHFRGMRESNSGYMYHVTPSRLLHFGGLAPDRKYDLHVKLPFHRGEFTIAGVSPGKRLTLDCNPDKGHHARILGDRP